MLLYILDSLPTFLFPFLSLFLIAQVRGPTDLSNFDNFNAPEPSEVPPIDNTGWDQDFGSFSHSTFHKLR